MSTFQVDKEKTLNAALFILTKLGACDYHKVFKILYFADQFHLKKYGQPLTGESYIAMPYGPVPSFLYDVFKAAEKGNSPFKEAIELSRQFIVKRDGKIPVVSAYDEVNLDELSESNIEVLTQALRENKALSFEELVSKSHDEAWAKAEQQQDTEISYLDMAKVAGTNEEMLKYISLNAENSSSNLV
ncbi:Panacea domain-containing protein [Pedobacter arcticus]|uniref:Panacea domain-containing protein n=1 Tax=Pedobacter arcticus TaxID=752140 RepID=UPI000309F01E|nr:Panacea domain-containing protein [Pedobacter arcticus]